MYCRNCGTELPDTAKFCRSCGAPQELPKKKIWPAVLISVLVAVLISAGSTNNVLTEAYYDGNYQVYTNEYTYQALTLRGKDLLRFEKLSAIWDDIL